MALSYTAAAEYNDQNIGTYLLPLLERHAESEQRRGLEIYTRQFLIDEGWLQMRSNMDMRLYDARGRESRRTVRKFVIEEDGVPDKTIGAFVDPPDIRGTVMLTWEQSYGADEQWLYIPSLKRTKKINAENKSGSFLGTEFAWEDISTSELSKYDYRYLGEGEEGKTWKVERIPVYKFSGYSRQVTWVDKTNYQTIKVNYYDKKGDLLKTEIRKNFEQYVGRYWRPLYLEMINHQNKKRTVLIMSPYVIGDGVKAEWFKSFGLARVSKLR